MPPAHAAFGTLVELMPEPNRSFHDDASIAGTSTSAGRRELIGRRIFRAATRVIGEWRAVSTDLVQLEAVVVVAGMLPLWPWQG